MTNSLCEMAFSMLANSGTDSSSGGVPKASVAIAKEKALPDGGKNFTGIDQADNPVYDTSEIFAALERKADVCDASRPMYLSAVCRKRGPLLRASARDGSIAPKAQIVGLD